MVPSAPRPRGTHAAQDIRELRDLLFEAWRDARRTAWRTVIRVATTSLLVVALLGAAIKLKFMGGSRSIETLLGGLLGASFPPGT